VGAIRGKLARIYYAATQNDPIDTRVTLDGPGRIRAQKQKIGSLRRAVSLSRIAAMRPSLTITVASRLGCGRSGETMLTC